MPGPENPDGSRAAPDSRARGSGGKMKSDKALRRIEAMRRNDHQPVAEYVAVLPPDLRNTVLDSLTLPERRALEHLLKARQERRRVRTIEDERIHKSHREVTAKQEAA